MTNLFRLLAPAAFLLAIGSGPALGADSRLAAVDELFAEWDRPETPGCALAVVYGGESVLVRGYGRADLGKDTPISVDTIFRLGAASESFTAAAVELAGEEGRISFEDDIRQILPELPRYQAPITVRHLLAQESGLPDYHQLIAASARRGTIITDELALATLVGQRFLSFDPGSRFKSSASNYFLLAQILTRSTGQSLRDFASQHLFRPRGMTRTNYHNPYRVAGEDHAKSYARSEEGGGFVPVDGGREILGPGGIETSAGDLVLWLSSSPPVPEDRHRVAGAGSHAGFRTAIVRRPEAALDVVCLCNLAEIDATGLARAVADLYLESPP